LKEFIRMDREARVINRSGTVLLFLGACANFFLALLHIGIILVGPRAYLYFGAARLAEMAAAGSPIPAVLTLILVIIFIAWGIYALSGSGLLPRLPWPRAALLVISFIYITRGSLIVLDLARLVLGAGFPVRQAVFSLGSLLIGLILLAGTIMQWNYLRPPTRYRS
jgi:hypothetical protein